MKVKHVFGGGVYLISSFGVARNPIFIEQSDVKFFQEKVDEYLSEICDIHAYGLNQNQFQYLIRIKERSVLEDFYYKKQAQKGKNLGANIYDIRKKEAADSYLIFSQEVSNLLNCYAKWFNFKYGRKGSLFGDRYQKYLIESEEEMLSWIDRLNAMKPLVLFSRRWSFSKIKGFRNGRGECSSEAFFEGRIGLEDIRKQGVSNFQRVIFSKLRGYFISLPPIAKNDPKYHEKLATYLRIHKEIPPW